MCMDRIIPTTKAVEFQTSEDRCNVIINVGGLAEKVIEAQENKPLDYEEGIIISKAEEDETIVKLAQGEQGIRCKPTSSTTRDIQQYGKI